MSVKNYVPVLTFNGRINFISKEAVPFFSFISLSASFRYNAAPVSVDKKFMTFLIHCEIHMRKKVNMECYLHLKDSTPLNIRFDEHFNLNKQLLICRLD